MASISDIREALAVKLEAIDGLRGRARVPDTVEVPMAVVVPGVASDSLDTPIIKYGSTYARGSHDLLFTVKLLVNTTATIQAQAKLDEYLDVNSAVSVKDALEDDPSLGGVAHFVNVRSVTHYGFVTVNGIKYLGADFVVEVTA